MTDNLGPNLTALCAILISFSTLFVALRCWAALIIKEHRPGWDDYLAALTIPFIISENAMILWWIKLGLGKHVYTLPPEDVAQAPKMIFIAALLNGISICLPKYSALLFYHRVFGKTSLRLFHIGLWTLGALNTGWLISAYLTAIFQCNPVRKAWDPLIPGKCFPQWNWFLGTALTSMVIDLGILILPMPFIWNLQAPISKKMLIMTVFFLGYGVIFVSGGRLVSLAKAGSELETDITWGTIAYIIWVQLEAPVSVICVSLPKNFQLVKRMRSNGFWYLFTGDDNVVTLRKRATTKKDSSEKREAGRVRLKDLDFGHNGKEDARVVTARGMQSAHPSQLTASEEDLLERGMGVAASNPDVVHIRQDVHITAQRGESEQ